MCTTTILISTQGKLYKQHGSPLLFNNYMKNDRFIMIFFKKLQKQQIKSNDYTSIWPINNIKEKKQKKNLFDWY
jgi:hypothetical protein